MSDFLAPAIVAGADGPHVIARRHFGRSTSETKMLKPEDRRAIEGLFDRLAEAERQAPQRDRDAEDLIRAEIGRLPNAPYYMAQTIVVQQQALEAAEQRIQELEAQVEERNTRARSPWDRAGDSRDVRQQQGGGFGGGGFMAGAMQTALGVAGGVLLGSAIGSLFGAGSAHAADQPSDNGTDQGSEADQDTGGDSGSDWGDAGGDGGGFDMGGDF
jgi:hypothetical protein